MAENNTFRAADFSTQEENMKDAGNCADEEKKSGIYFNPPLYTQRYSLAVKYLSEHKIKSVIDFGCSECNFIRLLTTVPSLEQIAFIDVDKNLLNSKKSCILPEHRHYIFKRSLPLHASIYAGSAEDVDFRVVGYEAITMIELIEHLEPDVLSNVTKNVFANLRPKLCIVTTPNAEFNVLFQNSDPTAFRHWDHKFEWNRAEFQTWCEDVCDTYGYTVKYSGVGVLPKKPETHHLGPCSQAAIFHLASDAFNRNQNREFQTSYELIAESEFPYEDNSLSLEDKIDNAVLYSLGYFVKNHRQEDTNLPLMIPVATLAEFPVVKSLCGVDGVRESLLRSQLDLSADGVYVKAPNDSDGDSTSGESDETNFVSSLEEKDNIGQYTMGDEDWDLD
ncbi:small RNA 2'-O-methyltransferase-like isoform X2 [Physella acuta]|uniref:small RNA 2'-O-methyltransferase-like isoform X2 n=1 Tax=Physella acuta TaxID=109671 RepID=UPI0027DBFB28|nr:small RNA 2'-O-methyltransferase-like isoform X2 [Physella acuta]